MTSYPQNHHQPQPKAHQALLPSLFSRQRSASLSDTERLAQNCQVQTLDKSLETTLTGDSSQPPAPPPWQRVLSPNNRSNKKRKFCSSPPEAPNTFTNNRFSSLPLDPADEPQSSDFPKPTKPPPIILNGIEDVTELSKLLLTVSSKEEFKFKLINKYLLHILVNTAEEYKKIIEVIRKNGLIGHTFTPKDKKCYRIVIKNLHYSTPHEAITEAIEATNNKVKGEIINARHGPDKKPTSTFFVNIEPSVNNPAVKNITDIYNQKIKIEDPRRSKSIVQCQRCQRYGHSKNNCMRPFRCVKCGEGHKTSECIKKDRSTPAKCALCSCDHPANYKGCEIYKDIVARRNKNLAPRETRPVLTTSALPNPSSTLSTMKRPENLTEYRTYAEVTNSKNSQTDQQSNNKLEDILLKQSEKMDLLIQQIGSLVGLITTLVAKLTK